MYDERCYYLALHFLPDASENTLAALAQAIQDTVESFDETEGTVDDDLPF